jgi:hypothetical protein
MTLPFPRLLLVGVSVLSMTGAGATLAASSSSADTVSTAAPHAVSVPASIDATGHTDVTKQLNVFIRSVPDNSVVTFAKKGHYRVEDVLKVTDKHHVTLDGNGATLEATTKGYRERNLVTFEGGSDLVVRNFHLEGAHHNAGAEGVYVAGLEGQHGLRIRGTQRMLIEDNEIEGVYGDFIYLGAELRRKLPTFRWPASDVVIRDNVLHSNGRQGMSFTTARRVLVQHNDIDDVKRTVFDFEPGASGARNQDVTIDDNRVGSHHLNFVSGGGNGTTNDIAVTNNVLHGDVMNTIIKNRPGQTRRNWTFSGNVSDRGFGSTLRAVVVAYGATNLRFFDNVQPMNRRTMSQGPMAALRMEGGCGGSAWGNEMGEFGGKQLIGTTTACATTLAASVSNDVVELPVALQTVS